MAAGQIRRRVRSDPLTDIEFANDIVDTLNEIHAMLVKLTTPQTTSMCRERKTMGNGVSNHCSKPKGHDGKHRWVL